MNWLNQIVRGNLLVFVFGLLGVYTIYNEKYLEGIVYLLVGFGFALTSMSRSESFSKYKRPLTIISWIVIMGAVIMFIVLLRTDAYNW